MRPYILLPRDPPHNAFMASWADEPLNQCTPLVWADRCEELGLDEEAEFLRFLAEARWSDDESSAVPADWPEAIGRLPPEWRSVFAIGCTWRCISWIPDEYRQEQLEDLAELIRDLGVVPFSKEASSRADATWSRLYAAWSRTDAASSRTDADSSRAYAAWSRSDAASSRSSAANSRSYAASSQWYAASSRTDADSSRSDAAEERWQVRWLEKLCWFAGVPER